MSVLFAPTGVKLETQDGTLDLADIAWQEIAPCGCVGGVTTASGAGDLIVTPEQAARKFSLTDAEYKQTVERGFSWRPRERKAACDEMVGDCPHDPKWGYEHAPLPEGYKWAAIHALGRRPKTTHLVTASALETAKARDYSAPRSKSLCGRVEEFHWSDEWYATTGKVECAQCWRLGASA